MPEGVVVVAAFDVDGTLTTRDCVVPFLRTVSGTFGLMAGLLRRAGRLFPAVLRGDRDRIKEIASGVVFSGRSIDDVEAEGARFAQRVLSSWMRADTVQALAEHRDKGHQIVFVSASYGPYLRPFGAALGVHGVVCTELVVDEGGCCTGELDGGNCRGAAKVARLHRWLTERHDGRANVELWAYGDSPGDRPMLEDADHGFYVPRPRRPRAAAPSLALGRSHR